MKPQTYLTDRFFMIFGACQLIGVLSLLFPFVFILYLASWPALVFFVWADRRSLPGPSTYRASLRLPRQVEIGEKVPIEWSVHTDDTKVLRSQTVLKVPETTTLRFDQESWLLRPEDHEGEILFSKRAEARGDRLGFESLPSTTLHVRSRRKLWFRKIFLPLDGAEWRVIPSRKRVSHQTFQEMIRQQSLFHQGNRRIVRGQAPEQFHSIREYRYPDPLRHLDARKSAKFNRPMTRTYESLMEHHLVLALDVGRSMRGRMGSSQKLDYYLSACLALAENAQTARDRVSFFALSQKVHYLVRGSRRLSDFQPVFRGDPAFRPREEETNFGLIHPTLSSVTGTRSLVLVLADVSRPSVQAELLKALKPVLAKHLTVVVSLLDEEYLLDKKIEAWKGKGKGNGEGQDLTVEDYSRFLYTYWLNDNVRVFQNRLAAAGGGVILIPDREWLSAIGRLYELLRVSLRL